MLLDGLSGARVAPLCNDLAGEAHELLDGAPLEVPKLLQVIGRLECPGALRPLVQHTYAV